MYLSKLIVKAGARPDRRTPGRDWIEQPYRVHQRLCMAFPDPILAKQADPEFLDPFDPARFFDISGTAPEWDAMKEDLPLGAHVQRGAERGFLFRIEADHEGQPFILVQSGREPDWEYAFHNASYLIAKPPQVLRDVRTFRDGEQLCFLLHAHPSEKTKRLTEREKKEEVKREPPEKARRLTCTSAEKQIAWLERKAKGDDKGRDGGFALLKDDRLLAIPGRMVRAYRGRDREEKPISVSGVRFQGVLEVTEPGRFIKTLRAGLGPAKAFGFGLLSVAPV